MYCSLHWKHTIPMFVCCSQLSNPAPQCKALVSTRLLQSDNAYLSLAAQLEDWGKFIHHRFPIKVLIPGVIYVSAMRNSTLSLATTEELIQHKIRFKKHKSWSCFVSQWTLLESETNKMFVKNETKMFVCYRPLWVILYNKMF